MNIINYNFIKSYKNNIFNQQIYKILKKKKKEIQNKQLKWIIWLKKEVLKILTGVKRTNGQINQINNNLETIKEDINQLDSFYKTEQKQ